MTPVKIELTDFKTKEVIDTLEVSVLVPYRSEPSCKVLSLSPAASAGEPGVTPVKIELTNFKTKEVVDTLDVLSPLVIIFVLNCWLCVHVLSKALKPLLICR